MAVYTRGETTEAPKAPEALTVRASDVTGFLNDNSWRYLDVVRLLKETLGRYAVSDEGRTVIHSIYSRGHKQRGGQEFKACWQIKSNVNLERQSGRTGFAIQDVDDIIGITVVCNFHGQVDRVADVLRSHDTPEGLISILKDKAKNEAGYQARHFVVQLRDPTYTGVRCEIQVKSVLQDAWSRWQHDLTYKPRGSLPARIHERMELVSDQLTVAGKTTESFKDEIEENWERERKRKDAWRDALVQLIQVRAPKGERADEYDDILTDLLEHTDEHRTGDVGALLERIEAFALDSFDLYSCWLITHLAAMRASDDLDFLAIDYIDRNIARAQTLGQRTLALNLKSIALFVFNQVVDAVEASELALESALEEPTADHVPMCQANLAYHLAELGDPRTGERAKKLVEAVLKALGGEEGLKAHDLDTVGLVLIVFGENCDEVQRGRELCARAVEATPARNQTAARAFHELHDRLAAERLEELGCT